METYGQQPDGGGSLESDIVPPDRSSSSSAPPALQLATESLFAFRVEYAKIFSDIRAHEDYVSFYESYKERERNLPPPLDPSPFFLEHTYSGEEEDRNRFFNGFSGVDQAQQAFQQLNLNQTKNVDIWNPLPISNRIRKGPLSNSFGDMNYASSPSAQTALNTANFIWKDEESPSNFIQEQAKLDSRPEPAQQFFNGDNQHDLDDFENMKQQQDGDPNSPRPNMVCRYYASGYCSRGDKCFYSHDMTQGAPIQQASPPQHSHMPTTPPQLPVVEPTSPVKVGTSTPASTPTTPSTPVEAKNGKQPKNSSSSATKSNARGNGKSSSLPVTSPNPNGKVSPRGSTNGTSTAQAVPTPGEGGYTFDQLLGKIYLVSKDQQGCRFLQKKLEEQEPDVVETIFSEVYDHITELMTDPFGNYLCQKLLEHCNDRQRFLVVERVAPDLVYISKNMHGTRAVQKMIECLSSPAQINIIKEALRSSVVELIQDLNGNHVIQRCLNRLNPEDNQFIYDAVTTANNCVEVATHRHGCCVLQRCIDHASTKQKVQLIQEITKNALTLIQDAYGNYVVQYVLELPFPELVDNLARSFFGNIRVLATQKFSSNVIEKCLGVTGTEVQALMVKEIVSEKANFLQMLQDPFANYVIQTALTVSDSQLHVELVEAIKPFLNQLRNTPYGKRIQSKIAKETAERARDKR